MDQELDIFLSLAQSDLETRGVGRSDEFETELRKLLLENGRRFIEALFNGKKLLVPEDERLPGEKRMGIQSRTVITIFRAIRISRKGYHTTRDNRPAAILSTTLCSSWRASRPPPPSWWDDAPATIRSRKRVKTSWSSRASM